MPIRCQAGSVMGIRDTLVNKVGRGMDNNLPIGRHLELINDRGWEALAGCWLGRTPIRMDA